MLISNPLRRTTMKKLTFVGLFPGLSLTALALSLLLALGAIAPAALASWSTGTWDSGNQTCTCPTFFAGCKCVVK
jgi:hypothetical protein